MRGPESSCSRETEEPRRRRQLALRRAAAAFLLVVGGVAQATEPTLSDGQTIYVPVYSEVFFGDRSGSILVRASIFIRNTDPNQAITVLSSEYRDTKGKLTKSFVDAPVAVAPLATLRFDIPEYDTSGHAGPSMLVRWKAERPVNAPLVQAVMISTIEHQGISFVTEGRPIDPNTK